MIRSMLIATVLAAVAMPASAQMMDKNMDKKRAMTPTMEQCEGGYKKSYKSSMDWSKSKFKRACKSMMMKKDKM